VSKYRWIVFIICLLSGLLLACGSLGDRDIESHPVKRGEFVSSITVTGELRAVNSQVIHAPSTDWSLGQLKIVKIADDGSRVNKGDLLIQFDPSLIQKTIDDAKAQLEIAQAELAKSRVSHKSEMAGLVADLEIAELDYEISN
jgi:HlyD family secretion protein